MTIEYRPNLPYPPDAKEIEEVVGYQKQLYESLNEHFALQSQLLNTQISIIDLDDLDNTTLVDPNADRIVFWDDGAGVYTWLTANTGLAISGTNLNLSHLGLEALTDPSADRMFFWDNGGSAAGWLTPNDFLTISTTNLNVDALDEDDMASNSAVHLATQQSIKEYVDNSIHTLIELYLTDTADGDVAAYLVMDDIETGQGEGTVVLENMGTGDDQEIEQWVTPLGGLGAHTLIAGLYKLHVHAERTDGGRTVQLYWELWTRLAGGAETLRATSEVSGAITSKVAVDMHARVNIDVDINTTDRIVIKVYANVSSTPANDTDITLYMEGTVESHLEMPTPFSTISNVFVRRDGTNTLTADWNAGTARAIRQKSVQIWDAGADHYLRIEVTTDMGANNYWNIVYPTDTNYDWSIDGDFQVTGSSFVNQDLQTTATPTFVGIQASGAALLLQDDAAQDVSMFGSAAAGENPSFKITGWGTDSGGAQNITEFTTDPTYGYMLFKQGTGVIEFMPTSGNQEFAMRLKPSGTSEATNLELWDASGIALGFITAANTARIRSGQGALSINDDAAYDVKFFESAGAGENPYLYIYGDSSGTPKYGRLGSDTYGGFEIDTENYHIFKVGGNPYLFIASTHAKLYDNYGMVFGTDDDMYIGWYHDTSTLNFGTSAGVGSNVKMALTTTGRLGIGTSTPAGILDMRQEGAILSQIGTCASSGAAFHSPRMTYKRARNTLATPQTIVANDTIGLLSFQGYDGSGYIECGVIAIECQTNPTDVGDIVPSRLKFKTMDASGTLNENLRIRHDRGVMIFGMKAGANQGAAGAAANELWRDTADNSVMIGV